VTGQKQAFDWRQIIKMPMRFVTLRRNAAEAMRA